MEELIPIALEARKKEDEAFAELEEEPDPEYEAEVNDDMISRPAREFGD